MRRTLAASHAASGHGLSFDSICLTRTTNNDRCGFHLGYRKTWYQVVSRFRFGLPLRISVREQQHNRFYVPKVGVGHGLYIVCVAYGRQPLCIPICTKQNEIPVEPRRSYIHTYEGGPPLTRKPHVKAQGAHMYLFTAVESIRLYFATT